ncbi:MAG: DUF4129 domain-containing protein [Candidatus Lokiarchaeota archaeon]|nr:DUF4129 domain-containing protein [Candidatus Lokiarchaeota archaeon]
MAKKEIKKYWSQKEMRSFTARKLDTVRLLLGAGMQKEAMVYMLQIAAWLIENKHDVKKAPSATVKEYFTDLVKNGKLPPQNAHPIVHLIEEVLYSHHPMPPNTFEQYKERWSALYTDVVGEQPPGI